MSLNEYKKLLSWRYVKKIVAFDELNNRRDYQKSLIILYSLSKALIHWQVWLAILFLVFTTYCGVKIGDYFGLGLNVINAGYFIGGGIGAYVYCVIHIYEAKKICDAYLIKKTDSKADF